MSIRCTKCGTFLMENDHFCPNCGENAPQVLNEPPVYTSTAPSMQNGAQYNSNQYVSPAPPPYIPNNNPQYSPYQQQEEEMTVGKWLLTLFVSSLGFIGIIFLFIWGFGSGPKSRQNFCKAMLIFYAIAVALIFFLSILFVILGVSFSEMAESYNDYYYYGSSMANNIMSMFF